MNQTNTTTCESCDRRCSISPCNDCHKANLRQLLRSASWRENAATRSGDLPGETMLDTITREAGR